jgi:hypothetical protein
MWRIFFILSILLTSLPVLAQVPCELTVAESPRLLNLKLGMSVQDVNSVIGRDLKVKVKPEGERTFFKNYIKKPAKGTLAGIRAIFLSFFDGRLYQIELFYQEDYRWPDLGSLLRDYSSSQSFPESFWKVKNGYAKAQCGGFSLDADRVLGAHIQITDDVVMERVEALRKKK